jgi:hypothetical protein
MKLKIFLFPAILFLLLNLLLVPSIAQAKSFAVTDQIVSIDPTGNLTETGILEGAKYLIKIPERWNRGLVLYVHGYVFQDEGLELPQIDQLREALVGQGYAVAYSSYSNTGYSVESGIKSTYQLEQYFIERYKYPQERYLIGKSLGGNIILGLIENYRKEFSGALSLCGVMDGWTAELKYLNDFRVVFDYFTDHILPGKAVDIPSVLINNFEAIVRPIVTDLFTYHSAKVSLISKATGVPPTLEAFMDVLYFHTFATNDSIARAGGLGYGNKEVVYKASDTDIKLNGELNRGVERFEATPVAVNYFQHWYQPTGKVELPLLSIHNTADYIVPFGQELSLKQKIEKKSSLKWFSLQTVVGEKHNPPTELGHCDFTFGETLFAFEELVDWARYGLKPPNLDITNR